jgi:hypothetical protein
MFRFLYKRTHQLSCCHLILSELCAIVRCESQRRLGYRIYWCLFRKGRQGVVQHMQWSRRCSPLEPELSENNKTFTMRRRTVCLRRNVTVQRTRRVAICWCLYYFDKQSLSRNFVSILLDNLCVQPLIRYVFCRRHISYTGLNLAL